MGLSSLLTRYLGHSFFLPAHGRGAALPNELRTLLSKRAGVWDIPELPGFGGPLDENGEVFRSQQKSAEDFGAQRGWYGVNGATGLLQSALLSIARPGQSVLMPRDIHRSLINACVLGGIKPVLFDLPFERDRGHVLPPDGIWLQKVLDTLDSSFFEISAAVLVHPSYQGYAVDLSPLIAQLHQRGWPVLVDEAHGTHFAAAVDENLPGSALKAGADLVVHSLHKSASGLVQTAVLWMQGCRVDRIAVERSIAWLQTSSPSALFLASCEATLREFSKPSGKRKLRARINEARGLASQLRKIGLPLLENQDPLRLILHTAKAGISGFEADNWLISRGLVAELPEPGCLTFCLGLAHHKRLANLFRKRWDGLISSFSNRSSLPPFNAPPIPFLNVPLMDCGLACRAPWESIPLNDTVGRVSAEFICPYPPGIPMLVPGEELDQNRVHWLIEQQRLWPEQIPLYVKVVL